MLRSQFTRNSLASATQVVVSSGLLFATYWYLARTIGVEQIGIWSVVLAATSASSIANLGIATSTVKFVAKYLAIEDEKHAIGVVQTSILSVAVIIGFFLLIATPLFYYLLQYFIPANNLAVARTILPFAIGSFWINSIAATLQAALDGYQRIDLRSFVLIVSSLAFFALVLLLVNEYGLLGLAFAQVGQSGIVLLLSFYVFRRVISKGFSFSIAWSRDIFREIIGYSLQFQTITISRMLVEPITKALLSRYGGLAAAGFFEMALKLVLQIRSVIVVAYQAFVPAVASLHETRKDRIPVVYQKAMEFVLLVVVVTLPLIIVSSRPLSLLWLGTFSQQFSMFLILASIAWFVNLLSAPAYFINLGTGHLTDNIAGHVVSAVLNLVLCLILGRHFGAFGIVIGYSFSIGFGSLVTAAMYQKRNAEKLSAFLNAQFVKLITVTISGFLIAMSMNHFLAGQHQALLLYLVPIFIYLAWTAWPLWTHPVRRELFSLVRESLARSASNEK